MPIFATSKLCRVRELRSFRHGSKPGVSSTLPHKAEKSHVKNFLYMSECVTRKAFAIAKHSVTGRYFNLELYRIPNIKRGFAK